MQLKSIDLQGFKSFTDRTKIRLEGGISCVVGPNGSGKSNIADAVRWVLGEQSAKILRGQKMEDVIFSGSGKRKPVGMAEVILNIDNSDGSLPVEFAEVSVCRRAYRSGESEYRINGTRCRLKDVQELFLDSGISNNSLCMIGQGRVQQIVDMKPDERRSLIEEAAGVIKYRNRKKTAVRKLTDTEKNLDRLWDIISELSDRLEPLKEQKSKAETYLSLKEEADHQEINLLLQILRENKEKIDEIQEILDQRQREILDSQTRYTVLQDTLEVKKSRLTEEEEQQNIIRQQLFSLKTEKEKKEANQQLLKERDHTAAENIKRLKKELETILNRDDGFVLRVEELEQQREEKAAEKKDAEALLAQQESALQKQQALLDDLIGTLEMSRDELFDLASELANSRNELNYQTQELENNYQSVAETQKNKENLRAEAASLEDKRTELTARLTENAHFAEKQRQELEQVQAHLAAAERQITETAEAEVKSRMKLNSDQSRLKMLRELAETHEGFYPGVRALLHAKKRGLPIGEEILGAVVDLIDLDAKYAVAIEAALASAMQNLVVRDDTAAKAAVRYLKKEHLGRATFLPLQNLAPRVHKDLESVIGRFGVIGRASDVVECSAEVRPAIDFLLKNILLTENLEIATEIARETRQRIKIITLEGDVISPGGAISGGSRQRNAGDLLKKKAQMKELEKILAEREAFHTACVAKLHEQKAKSAALSEKVKENEKALREAEITRIALEKDLHHTEEFFQNAQKREQYYSEALRELQKDEQRLLARREEIQQAIADWEKTNHSANERIVQLQERQEAEKNVLADLRQSAEILRLDLVKKEQEYQNIDQEVARLRTEKSDLFRQEEEKRRDLSQWETQLKEVTRLTEENQRALTERIRQIHDMEICFGEVSNFTESIKEEIRLMEKESVDLSRGLEAHKEEVHRQEIRVTRLQTEWDNESKKLAETFDMTYEEALPYLDPSVSRGVLKRSVRELRQKIVDLGNVNVDAIAEYEEVFTRHQFLTAQRQDLLDAKASLMKVIKEMDQMVIKRFRFAFEAVNKEFSETFHQLFGGGSAALIMTEPENILETGIDMMVQPPGKKLVNYNLLSGGEKSLIGIALILAIFHVKPSPFCVLDEVDAALDEANVVRFAQYLLKYTDQTQFLVVTHRQGTMEVASSLWGVTMATDGVSKIVSVKLSDLQKTAAENGS